MEAYIYWKGAIGLEFANALAERRRAGVLVKLLLDAVGSATIGKEIQNMPAYVQTSGGRIDVLPSGHIVVPELRNNRVVEYDAAGKEVWQVAFNQPIAAVRLANGNTLVTSFNQPRAVELDRTGREVWEYKTDTRVTRAFRR